MSIETVLLAVISLLGAIVGVYLRSILKRLDKIEPLEIQMAGLEGSLKNLESMEREWIQFRIELTKLIVKMEAAQKYFDDQTIMRRDLDTVWRNIDDIKDQLKDH